MQPDTITPGGPQGLNRYSYVSNRPVNFNDPTGHMMWEGDGGSWTPFQSSDYCTTHPGACGGGGGDDGDDGIMTLKKDDNTPTVNPNGPPCERVFSASACQTTSKVLGIGVLVLDLTSLGLSATGILLELVGVLGGPEGLGAAIALYAETLNPIENALGATALTISAFNDYVITGETYINTSTTYQGTPSAELVLGSDTSVGIVTSTLGLSPEGVTDSVVNVGAVAYDAYRLTGGKGLIQTHIILTANGNLHVGFSFP